MIFVFLVEMEFYRVGQAGLEMTSSDPPTLASQNTGITGVSHCTSFMGISDLNAFPVDFLYLYIAL